MEMKVTKCFDCPFCHELISDYYCKLSNRELMFNRIFNPPIKSSEGDSPDWCSLKKEELVIRFEK